MKTTPRTERLPRVRRLFAALDRGDLTLDELLALLDKLTDRADVAPGPSRKPTTLGMPAVVL